jgi:hypothetical protein
MTHGPAARKHSLSRALLLLALPLACAVGVEPEATDGGDDEPPASGGGGSDTGGKTGGGSPGSSGSGVIPKAGSNSSAGGTSSPFGGTSSTGGVSSAGSAGKASGGSAGSAGSAAAGASGSGGASGGSGGSGGSPGGVCACTKKIPWVDNTGITWVTGDCFTVGDKLFAYVGTKMQTWANGSCNPTKQDTWCPNMDTDYKFTPCD